MRYTSTGATFIADSSSHLVLGIGTKVVHRPIVLNHDDYVHRDSLNRCLPKLGKIYRKLATNINFSKQLFLLLLNKHKIH